jgi:hypothetical protein
MNRHSDLGADFGDLNTPLLLYILVYVATVYSTCCAAPELHLIYVRHAYEGIYSRGLIDANVFMQVARVWRFNLSLFTHQLKLIKLLVCYIYYIYCINVDCHCARTDISNLQKLARALLHAKTKAVFRSLKLPKILQDSLSHRIFRRMHGVLNVGKKNN